MMAEEWVAIGKVRSVQMMRRELRVQPDPVHVHEFVDRTWVTVLAPRAEPMRCRVAATAWSGSAVIVTLAPGVTRDSVGRMKGAAVVLRPEEQTPPPGLPHVRHWVGLRVLGAQGECLGTVSAVFEADANAAFEVARPSGATVVLPAIAAVVEAVDVERGTVVVGDIAPYGVTDAEEE